MIEKLIFYGKHIIQTITNESLVVCNTQVIFVTIFILKSFTSTKKIENRKERIKGTKT